MRTVSVLVAALVAASSVAGHERAEEPRRIYYPRHIKRQFTNATITSFTSSLPAESDDPSSSPSRRQSNVLNSLDLDPPSVVVPAVTTVVVQSTVYVTPGQTAPSSIRNDTSADPSSDTVSATPTTDPTTSPSDKASETPSDTPSDSESVPVSRPTADPTSQLPVSEDDKGNSTATIDDPATSDPVVSVVPTPTPTSETGIVIAPTGIVSSTETTPAAPETTEPVNPIESIVSDIVSVITSVLPPLQNATEVVPDPTSVVTIPTDLPTETPGTGVVPSVTTDTPLPSGTGTGPDSTIVPPPSSTPPPDPPLSTNTTEPPPQSSTPPPTPSDTTVPPPSSTAPPPPPPSSTLSSTTKSDNTTNTPPPASTPTPTPTSTGDETGVTSIPHLGTVTNSQSWLPTTILVDPTSTTANTVLAPTTATGIPSALPKAIIPPETAEIPAPDDTELIQIGLLAGYNFEFVAKNRKVAAQIFTELRNALSYAAGISQDKILIRRLVPLDTSASMGYITTLAIVTYPEPMIDALAIDIKLPNSVLYNNPNDLTYNFTKQINPAIDIIIGSYPEDVPGGGAGNPKSTPGGNSPNGDPFSNEGPGEKSSSQQGTTAGIVGGAVFVAAAYGAVMFVIARRYKKKKQAHRRASSISNPSEMQQSPRSSPALMGGALLSRDFTGYGGVTGGAAGGRNSHNSHGSGRSGMGNSARTQYISAPVAQENSLGWN